MNILRPSTWSWGRQVKDRSFDDIIRIMMTNAVASGENVTPANAMRCSTVQAIVRALTNALGSYPIMVFKQTHDGDGKVTLLPQPEHQVLTLLRSPNKQQTQTQYFRRAMTHVALWGNFYAIKAGPVGGPVRLLRPLHPDSVEPIDNGADPPTYRVTMGSGQKMFSARQIHHITGGISVDGVKANSPVEDAAEAIGLCLAAERLLAELYGNGSVPSFLLTGGKFTSKEQYKLWVDEFSAVYGPGQKRGGVAMLPEGMGSEMLTFKPIDAQLLEARRFQRTEIASVWGVPPHKLADLERATFANIEHQSLEFVGDVMFPYVTLFEQQMERDFLTDEDRATGIVIRFDLDAAAMADFKTRVGAYKDLHAVGAINPNEIRARERMNPRTDPAGDAYAVPLNMETSDNVDDDDEESSGSGN